MAWTRGLVAALIIIAPDSMLAVRVGRVIRLSRHADPVAIVPLPIIWAFFVAWRGRVVRRAASMEAAITSTGARVAKLRF